MPEEPLGRAESRCGLGTLQNVSFNENFLIALINK